MGNSSVTPWSAAIARRTSVVGMGVRYGKAVWPDGAASTARLPRILAEHAERALSMPHFLAWRRAVQNLLVVNSAAGWALTAAFGRIARCGLPIMGRFTDVSNFFARLK